MLEGLAKRTLITASGDDWLVTAAGYNALGLDAPQPAAEAEQPRKVARTRENSKQAQVIAMLRHPDGATINEICKATGWQAHTVRGAFAGTFKKRLGLTIVSEKSVDSERVYRIAAEAADPSA